MHALLPILLTAFILTACNESDERTIEDEVQESVQANVESLVRDDDEYLLPLSENFINAFYSFDPARLQSVLTFAPDSLPDIVYYQGWAEGGNYKILERNPCVLIATNTASCAITVEDDPMLALGSDFKVTDTFTIVFADRKVISVTTSSDDLPLYYEAGDWVRARMPELIAEPCRGFFAGGPTPGDCARAMAEGYARFAASDEFPGL